MLCGIKLVFLHYVQLKKFVIILELRFHIFFAFNHDIRNEVETQELVQAISNLSVEQRKILKSLIKELK